MGSLDGRTTLIDQGSYSDLPLSGSEPRIPALYLDRARLYDRLDEAADGPVTGVVAPPGWGKTLLVAGWLRARRAEEHALWIGPQVPVERAVAMTQEVAGVDLVVLDDLHLLPEDEARTLLSALARPGRRVVALSRQPLARLVRSALGVRCAELALDDLAFTDDEIRALLEMADREAGHDVVRRIAAGTSGWPAAVQGAAADRDGQRGRTRHRPGRAVLAFVGSEVLGDLPDDVVDTALRVSVVDAVAPELAAHLAGAPVDLDGLVDAGLMAPSDDDTHAFVPGLAGCLREIFRRRHPTAYAATHARAAAWHAERGVPRAALDHAHHAGDSALAADLLRRTWTGLALEEPDRLRSLLLELPQELRRDDRDLRLALAAAWTAVDPVAARDLLRGVVSAPGDLAEEPAGALRNDLLENLVSLVATARAGELPARELVAADGLVERIQSLGGDAGSDLDDAVTAFALAQGTAALVLGRLERAVTLLRLGSSRASFTGQRRREQVLLAHEAIAHLLGGALGQAESCLARIGDDVGPGPIRSSVALARGLSQVERGDATRARRQLAEARRSALEPALSPLLVHAEAMADLLAGDYEVAWERVGAPGGGRFASPWLAELLTGTQELLGHRVSNGAPPSADEPVTPWGVMARATSRLLAGDPQDALDRAQRQLADGAERRTRTDLLLVAAAAALDVEPGSALGYAERALGSAELTGAWRAVQQLPRSASVRVLAIVEQRSGSEASRGTAIATRLRLGLPEPGDGTRPALSRRELLVLMQLGTGRPAAEIAAELYVSPNTLKTQLRSIYRKLGVGSRVEAVELSRDLGILR